MQVMLGVLAITPFAIGCLLACLSVCGRIWYGYFSSLAMESGVPGYGSFSFLYNTLLSCFDPGARVYDWTAISLEFAFGCVCLVCVLPGEIDGCAWLGWLG